MADTNNYVKICEAIQAFCELSLPTLQASIEYWHQNHQQTLQSCKTPKSCPSYKKPTIKSGACQSCIDWSNAIEAVCHPPGRGIQWKNVDATLLHKDAVEVAKGFVFIIPDGHTCKSFGDFDIGGILKMMMGFKECHQGDQACLDKMQKVLNLRNGLSHMRVNEKMHVSNKKLDDYYGDIEDLVNCLKNHQPSLKATDIQSCLNQIRQSKDTTKMLKQAQDPLTYGLEQALKEELVAQTQNLQHFIEIQAQSLRQTVEVGALKGADAVEARLTPHLKSMSVDMKNIPETVHLKMQPEISGLKQEVKYIKEDMSRLKPAPHDEEAFDIQAVKDQLVSEYRQTRGRLQLLPGVPEECACMEDLFVDMELRENVKKPAENIPRKLLTYRELVDLKDAQGEGVKGVLVKGNPGCGKSTLISKLAYDWAKNDPESCYEQYQLLFAIDMKEITPGANLMDVVEDQLLPEVSKESLNRYIKSHPDSVIWLFDGYDEADPSFQSGNCGNIKHLLSSKLLAQSCIIMTTRPHKVADINARYKTFNAQVELFGLSRNSVFNYIAEFFQVPLGCVAWVNKFTGIYIDVPNECVVEPSANQSEKVKNIASFTAKIVSSGHLFEMCRYPIMLTMICFLWKEEQELSQILTAIYLEAVIHMAKHRLAKSGDCDFDMPSITKQVKDLVFKLGQIALDGLLENKLMFTGEEFDPITLNEACQVGLISKERKRSKRNLVNNVSFLHKTFQEMAAAYYWASLADLDTELFIKHGKRIFNMQDKEFLLRFCCGMSSKATEIILPAVVSISCSLKDQIEKSDEHKSFLGHSYKALDPWRLPLLLLYESDQVCSQESEKLHSMLNPLVRKLKIEANCTESVSELWAVLRYFADKAQSVPSTWLTLVTDVIIADASNQASSHVMGHSQFLCKDPVVAKAASGMSGLKSLVVYGSDPHDGTPLLQNMANSSLASTSLNHIVYHSYGFCPKAMTDFLSRQSSLTYFEIRGSTAPPPFVKDVKKDPQDMAKAIAAIKSAPVKVLILDDITLDGYVTCLAPLLPQLSELQISRTYVEETNDCKKLFQLFLDAGQKLPLVKLNVQGNDLCDGIQEFSEAVTRKYLSDLQYLNMRNGGLREQHFQFFGPSLKDLPQLIELDLVGLCIGSAMKELGQGLQHLKNLKVLVLHGTDLTEESVPFLPFDSLQQLKDLSLGSNKFGKGIAGLAQKLKHLHNLRKFELSCSSLTDEDVALLPLSSFPYLISLDLCFNALWSDGLCTIARHLQHMPHLEKLILHSQNKDVCDEETKGSAYIEGIEAIFRNLPYLPNLIDLQLPEMVIPYNVFIKSSLLTKCVNAGVAIFDGRPGQEKKSFNEQLMLPGMLQRKKIKAVVDVIQKS